MLGEAAGAEVIAQRTEAEGETPAFGSENAAVPAAEAKLLDASTLQPGESLAGRDLQGWTLRGDFSGRDFDGANLRRAVARCANFRNASRLPWREPRRRGCSRRQIPARQLHGRADGGHVERMGRG